MSVTFERVCAAITGDLRLKSAGENGYREWISPFCVLIRIEESESLFNLSFNSQLGVSDVSFENLRDLAKNTVTAAQQALDTRKVSLRVLANSVPVTWNGSRAAEFVAGKLRGDR